ncbi:hypothetical protein D3C76_797640 [compost metagenome]
MNNLHELKMAVTLEHQIILTLYNGDTISGLPKWGEDPKRVKLRTVEGAVWVPLEEIEHVTRIIPLI